jgi:hypothetical protein
MHVGTGPKQRTRELTADELPAILDEIARRGYPFRRVKHPIGSPQAQPVPDRRPVPASAP